ncbi:MAG: hypothetical protein ABI386_06645 [Rhodanobacter sp.]
MTIYWRVRDIPELRGVRAPRCQRLWSEAQTRSLTVGQLLLTFAIVALFALLTGWLGHLVWPSVHRWIWFELAGIPCGVMVSHFALAQPRGRRWLRAHAHELGRYVPP